MTRVYHHHAHASALMGEHGVFAPSLVFTWDGVGYGEDQTSWGGEALLGRPGQWRRFASLRPFRLLGGDRASREPWRNALALCWETGAEWPQAPRDIEPLRHAWEKQLNCPLATSAGRLFDAAAALVGAATAVSYEGHAAMVLESLSRPCERHVPLPLAQDSTGLWRSDWAPMLAMLLDDALTPAERGSRFHAGLAHAILQQALKAKALHAVEHVGLAGGVFQNRLLTEQTVALLTEAGFQTYLPTRIPANDAGVSIGQIFEGNGHVLPIQALNV